MGEVVLRTSKRGLFVERTYPCNQKCFLSILGNIHRICNLLLIRKLFVGNIHWKCNLFLTQNSSAPNINWKSNALQSLGLERRQGGISGTAVRFLCITLVKTANNPSTMDSISAGVTGRLYPSRLGAEFLRPTILGDPNILPPWA